MFTGLVTSVGSVLAAVPTEGGVDLRVELAGLPQPSVGDSIALSGVCCTVTAITHGVAQFHLGAETLRVTWLGRVRSGTRLNLEAALRAGDAIGGHLVQGHVDGVGELVRAVDRARGGELRVRLPAGMSRYVVSKGSITFDGVSLTVIEADADLVACWIIPHTACTTTLGELRVGSPIHVEVDILAKYVERLIVPYRQT